MLTQHPGKWVGELVQPVAPSAPSHMSFEIILPCKTISQGVSRSLLFSNLNESDKVITHKLVENNGKL